MTTIFLSTATSEFGALRRRLASIGTRTRRLHVRHQDEFVQRGVLTLHVLEEEIRDSNLVVHVVGTTFGATPPIDQVEDLLRRHRDFESKFPDVAARARQSEISYTQWEAWLALYFQSLPGNPMRLCSYLLGDLQTDREPLQAAHLQHLRDWKIYPKQANTPEGVIDEVLLTLIELGCLTEEESRLIVHLPYPSLGTLFKGRDEFLEQLRESLQRHTGRGATAITGKAVHGLGGVGKTRLAVEYAWQHADQYSAVLCVTADTPENLRQNLAELTGPLVLNLPEHAAKEEAARVGAALRWLDEHPGWFLILDNIDTDKAAEAAEELLARLHGGQVLITSRLGKWSGSVEPLELDVLATGAATGFLLERTQPKRGGRGRVEHPADQTVARDLAEALDGLALALEQAGAYICQKRISLAEYLKRWRTHEHEVQTWHDRAMKYPQSMAVTWQTTLDQFMADEVVLLNVLAWLAPEPVPLFVLDGLSVETLKSLRPCRSLSADMTGNGPETSSGEQAKSECEVRDLLPNLADYGMIRWDPQADMVNVHRVVQEILRTRQCEPIPVLTAALRMLQAALPAGNPDDVRTWPRWDLLRPHVAFAAGEADQRDIAEPASFLMGALGQLLSSKALYNEAERWERRGLAIDERHFGSDSTEVALRLNNLAQTLQATNRLAEAEPLIRRALAIDEQSYGNEHPTVARDLNNLALLLQATNRLAEAELLMARVVTILEKSLGENHPIVATALNNLALLLQDTNRLAEAEPLMRRSLDIDEQAYGSEHPKVAIRLNNLAQLLQATNRLAEAEPLMARVVTIFEKSLGENHPNVATALNNLAQLLQATNRLAEAEPLMRRALAIDEQSYGTEHPNVAIRLNNLASLLQATNRLAEAEPLMRRALVIDEQSYGSEHPAVARDLNNLASLLLATNRLAEAEPLMRRALAIDEQSYGSEHPDVARDLNNLAQLLQATNRLAEAEPLMRRALAITADFQRRTGYQHPHFGGSRENYRSLLAALDLPADEIDRRVQAACGK